MLTGLPVLEALHVGCQNIFLQDGEGQVGAC